MKNTILFLATAFIMASCNNNTEQQAAIQARQVDSLKNEMAKKQIIDSMNTVNAAAQAAQAEQAQKTVVHTTSHTQHRSTSGGGSVTNNYTTTNAATAPAPTKKVRKGLGPTATGAIIGAGAGAITGAMVDKKKGEGAVVGGILGAGAGAGVGAIINKKQKQKDAENGQ